MSIQANRPASEKSSVMDISFFNYQPLRQVDYKNTADTLSYLNEVLNIVMCSNEAGLNGMEDP